MIGQTSEHDLWVSVGDGSVFRVAVTNWPKDRPSEEAAEVFGSYWPPIGVEVESNGIREPEREFSVDLGFEDSLVRFESDFGLYVSEKLPSVIAVHAALIEIDEALVIVPGSSGSGKSSLGVAAMEAGFHVWSDEYCLIDTGSGDVSGWPRPIRQRLTGGGVKRISHQGPQGPGRATHVISMKYVASEAGSPLTLEPMSPGQVAMELMANTVCARSRPEETFRTTTTLARQVTGFLGSRGDVSRVLGPLRDLLRQDS